jgi:hypothetical protein
MAVKTPKRIFIKPAMVDCGRGPQLAMIPFPTAVAGRRRVLPPEGAEVSLDGGEGSYWRRRLGEDPPSVVVVDPTKPAEPKAERIKKGNEQ